jgi:hypothetical protein
VQGAGERRAGKGRRNQGAIRHLTILERRAAPAQAGNRTARRLFVLARLRC